MTPSAGIRKDMIPVSNPIITIEMENGGVIKAELYPEIAPNTVNNFIHLIQKGFYDGLIFHRVEDSYPLPVFYILCRWHSLKPMLLFILIPHKFSFYGKPSYILIICYTSMQYLIIIDIQSHEIPFALQYRIIIDHKSIHRREICNANVSDWIHIIHFISISKYAA